MEEQCQTLLSSGFSSAQSNNTGGAFGSGKHPDCQPQTHNAAFSAPTTAPDSTSLTSPPYVVPIVKEQQGCWPYKTFSHVQTTGNNLKEKSEELGWNRHWESTAIKNVKAKPAIWSFPFSNSLAANLLEAASHFILQSYLTLAKSISLDGICLSTYSNLIQLLAAVTEC